MAEVTVFHYFPNNTILHKMDGRLKLLCMVLLSLAATFAVAVSEFALLTVVVALAVLAAKLPIGSLLKDMKLFALLIALVVVVNAFSIPGNPLPYFPIPGVSEEGLIAGGKFAWRLTIIIFACAVLTGTTSMLTFKNVIEWYLHPVPFVPAARVATMVNMTFVFIPVIFDQYREMMNAQKARCIEIKKNPIRRIKYMAAPLLTQTFRKTDQLISAMEARCYSEVRTRAIFRTRARDWLLALFCLLVLILVVGF